MNNMLLSGEEIKARGLVNGANELGYRASTYDLRVGTIVSADPANPSDDTTTSYRLVPGGMVRVISAESLQLPHDVTSHVLLKNELCRKGVLAIHIGVVDPGFRGPLSSTLINFGKNDFFVKLNEPFLRVSYFTCSPSPKALDSKQWEQEEYVARVREEVLAYAAPTFLDVEHTTSKAADKMYGKFKEGLITWSAIAVLVVAVVTVFVPLGASYTDRYVVNKEKLESDKKAIEASKQYDLRIRTLESKISELQTALERQRPSPSTAKGAR
jgi:deoxycytidine triphosphate deaminase